METVDVYDLLYEACWIAAVSGIELRPGSTGYYQTGSTVRGTEAVEYRFADEHAPYVDVLGAYLVTMQARTDPSTVFKVLLSLSLPDCAVIADAFAGEPRRSWMDEYLYDVGAKLRHDFLRPWHQAFLLTP